jgi:hypothetical protein
VRAEILQAEYPAAERRAPTVREEAPVTRGIRDIAKVARKIS